MKKLLAIGAAALILSTTAVGTVGADVYKPLGDKRYEVVKGIRTQLTGGYVPYQLGKQYITLVYRARSIKEIEELEKEFDQIYNNAIENGIIPEYYY